MSINRIVPDAKKTCVIWKHEMERPHLTTRSKAKTDVPILWLYNLPILMKVFHQNYKPLNPRQQKSRE